MPPAGFKRSRALWDETRRPHTQAAEHLQSILRAILYELQPIRFREIDVQGAVGTFHFLVQTLKYCITNIPTLIRTLYVFSRERTQQQWMMVGGVIAYYYLVRFVHDMLDAGPMLMILTGLTAIFTFGLSDNENTNGVSAYSVFNRGFQRILGSVDVDSLLAQHVGGGFGGVPMPVNGNRDDDDDDDDFYRLRPAAAARLGGQDDDDDENDNNDSDDDDHANPDQNNNGDGNGQANQARERARKSGKKARRRDLDQRREVRRQREAAAAMGLHGEGNQDDTVAMQRLIEEQIAAERHVEN